MNDEIEGIEHLKLQMTGLRERRRDLGMQIAAEDSCHKATLIEREIRAINKAETEMFYRILMYKEK